MSQKAKMEYIDPQKAAHHMDKTIAALRERLKKAEGLLTRVDEGYDMEGSGAMLDEIGWEILIADIRKHLEKTP